jgi:hypothetical protein
LQINYFVFVGVQYCWRLHHAQSDQLLTMLPPHLTRRSLLQPQVLIFLSSFFFFQWRGSFLCRRSGHHPAVHDSDPAPPPSVVHTECWCPFLQSSMTCFTRKSHRLSEAKVDVPVVLFTVKKQEEENNLLCFGLDPVHTFCLYYWF